MFDKRMYRESNLVNYPVYPVTQSLELVIIGALSGGSGFPWQTFEERASRSLVNQHKTVREDFRQFRWLAI